MRLRFSNCKWFLEINVHQLHLQVWRLRPRNAVECSASSSSMHFRLCYETEELYLGWWWSSLSRLLSEAQWIAVYRKQLPLSCHIPQPQSPWGQENKCLAWHGIQMGANKHLLEESRILAYFPSNLRRLKWFQALFKCRHQKVEYGVFLIEESLEELWRRANLVRISKQIGFSFKRCVDAQFPESPLTSFQISHRLKELYLF